MVMERSYARLYLEHAISRYLQATAGADCIAVE